jgi:hypothetical protein
MLFHAGAAAQRRYTVRTAAARTVGEQVRIKTTVRSAPSKGLLVVLLNPKVPGEVIVKNPQGKVVMQGQADEDGQAEFQLPRGLPYQVEVKHPSYLGSSVKSRPLGPTDYVQADLTPQFASMRLRDLPLNSQVFIDNEPRGAADQSGNILIANIKPGDRELLVRHPEYEDYIDRLTGLEAGVEVTYPPLRLLRVARLSFQGPPGANIMIDGDFWGRIKPNGTALVNYELEQIGERTISVEKIGFQTWSRREVLKTGVRTFEVALDPIVTAAGFSDFFEDLSLWSAPPPWKVVTDQRNKKLEVRGETPGLLTSKVYRDFQMNFMVWFNDDKGATWIVRADPEGRNYYLFHLSGAKSESHTPRRFHTFLVSNGGKPQSVSTPVPVIPELNNRTSYTIHLVVKGNQIRHSITPNDSGETFDLGSWTDESTEKDRRLYGTVGFRSLSGEVFAVDDLAVSLELPND